MIQITIMWVVVIMRILYISINKEKSLRPALPIGMIVVATETVRHNHEVKCVDLCFEEDNFEAIKRAIDNYTPDIIGISVRNIDSLSFLEPVFYLPLLKSVVISCRELIPQCKIILGGAGYTLIPEEVLEYSKADYGIVSGGEKPVPMLLERISKNETVEDIPGLVYRRGDGRVMINRPDYNLDLNEYSFPDRNYYDNRYFTFEYSTPTGKLKTVETIQSKKGCVISCIYCNNPKIEGPRIRLRSPNHLVDEIEKIQSEGKVKGFEFVDGIFNLPYNHAMEICKEMERRRINIPWTCMMNPGKVTHELVEIMARTGCHTIEFGSDSGSDKILEILNKQFTAADIRNAHELTRNYGIKVMHCVFIGSPGETKESLNMTFDLMDDIAPSEEKITTRVYFNFGFRIFDNTRLHEIALEEGVICKEDNLAVPKFYISPTVINDESILDLIEQRVTKHDNWYMWWGLPNISLKERVNQVKKEYRQMEELYYDVLNFGG